MSKARPFIFLFVLLALVWPAAFYFHRLNASDDNAFREVVSSDAFRMGLRLKSPDGCVALASMDRLNLVIVGNSHVFDGIDVHELAEAYPGKSVGVCALGHWNTDAFAPFLGYLDDQGLAPERVIWVADLGTLGVVPTSAEFQTYYEALFSEPSVRAETQDVWTENIENGRPALGVSETDYANGLAQMHEALADVDPQNVEAIVRAHDLHDEIATRQLLKQLELNPRNDRNLRQLCAGITQRSITLDIVVYPLLPTTIELGDAGTADTELAMDIGGYLTETMECARRVVDAPLAEWQLDARHFINRWDTPGYDYGLWNDAESFAARYDALSGPDRARLFDTDHLNPVGAKIFTRELVRRLD
ncbi:MAG: hypothetical protein AAFQ22_01440 [Pseudomonadota bacterium]